MIGALGQWVEVAVTVLALWIALSQWRSYERENLISNIRNEWNQIYTMRNSIMSGKVTFPDGSVKLKTLDELENLYPTYDAFFADNKEWPEVRKLCSFYENLGSLLYHGKVDRDRLFGIVTIEDEDNDTSKNIGPYISYLRGGKPKQQREPYREDIYVFCDYIFNEWDKHHRRLLQPYAKNSKKYKFSPPS